MKRRLRNGLVNSSIVTITLVVGLVSIEVVWRLINGIGVFTWENWMQEQAFGNRMGTVVYDPVTGWRPPDYLYYGPPTSPLMSTIEYGIRKNDGNTTLRQNSILAVGDSFTAGTEVADHQSWPAILETMRKEPVTNAGVGGYGVDQIILRAEKLLPIVKPKLLIIGMLDQDILRVGYSSFGAPKPYFAMRNGKLVHRNNPVPTIRDAQSAESRLAGYLGYSRIFHDVIIANWPNISLNLARQEYEKTSEDPVVVTCALIERLKRRTYDLGLNMVVVMQYGGGHFAAGSDRPLYAELVLNCVERMNIPVVDEFEALRKVAAESRSALESLYVMREGTGQFGHMTEKGNRVIAELVNDALDSLPAKPSNPPSSPATMQGACHTTPEPAPVVLVQPGVPQSTANVRIKPLPRQSFSITATGRKAVEHYASIIGVPLENKLSENTLPGTAAELPPQLNAPAHSLAIDFRTSRKARGGRNAQPKLRIQLVAPDRHIIGDIDLSSGRVATRDLRSKLGIAAKVFALPGGGYRFGLTTHPMAGPVNILIQLLDKKGSESFIANGETLTIDDVRLLRGRTVTRLADLVPQPVVNTIIKVVSRADMKAEIMAAGKKSEHYFAIAIPSVRDGCHEVRVDVARGGSCKLRVQLIGNGKQGIIGDVDVCTASTLNRIRVGGAKDIGFRISRLNDKWSRVIVNARLNKGSAAVFFQLLDAAGKTVFAPKNNSVILRNGAFHQLTSE